MAWTGCKVRRITDGQEGIIIGTKDQQITREFRITLDNGEQAIAHRYAWATGNPKWQVKFDGIGGWAYLDD